MASIVVECDLGRLRLEEQAGAITGCRWTEAAADGAAATPLLERAARQLAEYFAGERAAFDLPLAPAGTPFQRRVWQALTAIPYGETRSYRKLAAAVGSPGASRAVGTANARNPVSIFIPCHRVIRASGEVGGYSGGSAAKGRLLALEAGRAAGA